jgi:pimeloyl-ACP methyl ester carboxylesterase
MGETRLLGTPAGTIAYDDTGGDGQSKRPAAGAPVVCVPGMGDVRGVYRYLVPALTAAGHRVVTMDVRGHGESSTGWDDYSAAAVGGDVVALLRHLDAGPAHVVGGSMAAASAMWAAAEAPALVAGIVLLGPFVRDVPQRGVKRLLAPLAMRLVAMRPGLWARYYRSLYPTSPPADLDAYIDALTANLAEPGRLAALRGMLAASKASAEARIGEVKAPVLVVMGSADPDFEDPLAEAELVAARLGAKVVMVAGAGHYPQAERPEVTGPAIVEFIGAHG